MNFRIRSTDTDDHSRAKSAEAAYREHLDAIDKSSGLDLWRYFYSDFFHDGWIRSMSISEDMRTVVVELIAANVARIGAGGGREYLEVGFRCEFRGVVNMSLSGPPRGCDDLTSYPVTFLYGEIDTSPVLASLVSDEEDSPQFHSLLISLTGVGQSWLELVFDEVCVSPHEPVAFALMEADERFEVRLYDRE